VFSGLSRGAVLASAYLFKSHIEIDASIRSLLMVGMVCTVISVFYLYKLYRVEDFTFEKYLRFKN